jgi:DNA-binding Xre family transcriptional regulator
MGANVHQAHIAVKPTCAWSGMEQDLSSVHDMHMRTSTKRKTAPKVPEPTLFRATFMWHWRKKRGKTQEDMAEILGMTHGQLSKIENGKQPYNQHILETYAKVLECTVVDLLTRQPGEAEHVLSVWSKTDDRGRQMMTGAAKILDE